MKKVLRFSEIKEGDVFPPVHYSITSQEVEQYRNIFPGKTYSDEVPPFLLIMKTPLPILANYQLLSGTVHVSQEVEFFKKVKTGMKLSTKAKVVKKMERRKLKYAEFEVETCDEEGETVLWTKFAFVFPE